MLRFLVSFYAKECPLRPRTLLEFSPILRSRKKISGILLCCIFLTRRRVAVHLTRHSKALLPRFFARTLDHSEQMRITHAKLIAESKLRLNLNAYLS
jgi:hypothetical protein